MPSLYKENPEKYVFIIDFDQYACFTRELSLYLFGERDLDTPLEKEDILNYPFYKA